jgi:hypothetical protein
MVRLIVSNSGLPAPGSRYGSIAGPKARVSVLVLQFCTGYPQADRNRSATKRERARDRSPAPDVVTALTVLRERPIVAGSASCAIGAGAS